MGRGGGAGDGLTLAAFSDILQRTTVLMSTLGLSRGSFIQQNMVTGNRSVRLLHLHGMECIWVRDLYFLRVN